ncbi:unnamed protein product [Protopolystoma xenopodis]|uniref:Uncharacterized protein n=1 Tax=Protopolystoma xenopodis TaxID=117903 RepID=A0A3S4ZP22_9PLAT|nr:unnamed protein product [Protopolystoma xenopodis]
MIRVELAVIFVKIGQVDTVNERYQADIFLQARWREPLLDATWNSNRLVQQRHLQSFVQWQNIQNRIELEAASVQRQQLVPKTSLGISSSEHLCLSLLIPTPPFCPDEVNRDYQVFGGGTSKPERMEPQAMSISVMPDSVQHLPDPVLPGHHLQNNPVRLEPRCYEASSACEQERNHSLLADFFGLPDSKSPLRSSKWPLFVADVIKHSSPTLNEADPNHGSTKSPRSTSATAMTGCRPGMASLQDERQLGFSLPCVCHEMRQDVGSLSFNETANRQATSSQPKDATGPINLTSTNVSPKLLLM